MNKYKDKENYVFDFDDKWNRGHNKGKILNDYKKLLKGKVAEMGCNSGYHCFIIAENNNVSEVVGFDINKKSISFADEINRKKFSDNVSEKVRFVATNLTEVESKSSYFDVIISFHTLEHIYPEDLSQVLKEKYRVLRKGGILLVSLPYKKAFDCEQHVNYFDLKKLESAVTQLNFIKKELYIDDRMSKNPAHLCITGIFQKK